MKVLRRIIKIDEDLCNGCGQCAPACAEGAIAIVDGKAKLLADNFCDGLGACLGECPTGALKIEERVAEDFDEEAVERHLATQQTPSPRPEPIVACGCPSAQVQTFHRASPCEAANRPVGLVSSGSALTHWPVQIRLVPPTAPFLKGANLLVVADCSPLAYPAFHEKFLRGRVAIMGCPKFDNADEYIQRFKQIFERADIKSVTHVIMEVPCCSAMPVIVRRGMEAAGKNIPTKTVVISTRGEILGEKTEG